jgi:PAS domain S-box-containing protein
LLEVSNDLLALLDARGNILWVNGGFERASGFRASTVRGRALWDALGNHDDQAPAWQQVRECLSGADALQIEALPWHDGNGMARIAQARLRPLRENEREAGSHWLWCMQDTTVLRRLDEEKTLAVERLETAQDFGRLGLWQRELPLGKGHWDRHMFRMWGFDPKLGTPDFGEVVKRIHPDDRPGELYRASSLKVGKYSKRYRIILPGGQLRHVHAQWEVKNGPEGTPALLTGVMVDDTEVYDMAESFNKTSAQLKLAVDLGNIAIWRHDLRTDRLYYNDKAFEVIGIKPRPEGLSLDEVRKLIHPDDLPRVVATAQQSLSADRPVDMEARYRRTDGSWRYVLTRRMVRRNAEGEPVEFVGVALDITEQVEKTRRAQELAKRLEVAASAAGLGIWSREPDRPRGEWNPQMFEMLGRPPALGVPTRDEWLEQIVHPDDRQRMRTAHDELRATEDITVEHEYRIVRPSGEVRWLVNRARHEKRDGKSLTFGITIDVTERVQTEAALRQANERIALAAHGAGIGTWERDVATDVVLWDQQMYVLRGLSPDCGKSADELRFELAHPDDLPRVIQANEESVREGKPLTYEFRARMPDGNYRWLASRSLPIFDAGGRVVRQVGVNWDVHERVTAEAERQEKLIAQRESQAKSEFLARMSHELRTPLNAVLGFAQLLQLDPALAQDGTTAKLRHIQSAGEHLLSLINDVLDLSSLESGQLKLDLQAVPLAEVLREAMNLVEPAARAANVSLDAQAMRAVVRVDRTRMRQVLLNLLSNAVKYNRPGGEVMVSAHDDGDFVVLRVRDTGRGMTRQQMAHLFEPFNRLGVEREGIEGAGIGLAVVKALVERMGGAMRVDSNPGTGSSFDVRLPRAAERTAPKAKPQPHDTAPGSPLLSGAPVVAKRGQILYIEDNPVNVLLVEELVRGHAGLQIESVGTGLEGVARAAELRPDLVLVDMQLPDIHGFEVLERLRAQAETAQTPCIALSANAMPDDIARATAAGFADYWTKPINFASFLAALNRLFPG